MRRLWILVVVAGALALCADAAAQTTSAVRAAAAADTSTRILVSISARRLWVVSGSSDTLLSAPVAVGSGKTLRTSKRTWVFNTPRGVHTVVSKDVDPIWVRPDWAYVEVARKHGLRVAPLDPRTPVRLADGRSLEMRNLTVGIVGDLGQFSVLPVDEELIFDGVLYVPPVETRNRRVAGQLGRFRLNVGDGIGIHGTPDSSSVGRAVTHGCMRVRDSDLEWLHEHIPIGTRVYIF